MSGIIEAAEDPAVASVSRLLVLADAAAMPAVEAELAVPRPGRLTVEVRPADAAEGLEGILRAALDRLPGPAPDVVLIHDSARPPASAAVVARVLGALADGARVAVPAVPVVDTIKTCDAADPGFVGVTVDRGTMRTLQGPWGFAMPELAAAIASSPGPGEPSTRHLGRRLMSLAGRISRDEPALLRLVDGDPAASAGRAAAEQVGGGTPRARASAGDGVDGPAARTTTGRAPTAAGVGHGAVRTPAVDAAVATVSGDTAPGIAIGSAPSAAGVVLVGGSGSRFGAALNKAYMPLAGRAVVSWSLDALAETDGVGPLVLVIRPEDRERAEGILAREVRAAGVEIVYGGPTRQASELAALRHLAPRIGAGLIDTVLIHDGARPLASSRLAGEILAAARRHGGAIPAIESFELAAMVPEGVPALDCRHPGDDPHLLIQTPQGFEARELLAVYERAEREGFEGTDTASCLERFSELPVAWVPGSPRNFKITFPRDLALAEDLLAPG